MQATREQNRAVTISRGAPPRPRYTWDYVHSVSFDWVFFLAPFWVSALYALSVLAFPKYEMAIFLFQYVVLAETHFASTWLIFLDPVNRQHYSNHKLVYYFVPFLIMSACLSVAVFFNLGFLILITGVASAIHVMRQSTGIVALYRNRLGDRNPERRKYDNLAIYASSFAFLAVGALRFYISPQAFPDFLFRHASLMSGLHLAAEATMWACVLSAVYFVWRVIKLERQRLKDGNPLSLSKWLVFTYSLLLYSPYLFASRMEHAIAMGVGIHYVQYLGIVWWLNRNKYGSIKGSRDWGLNILGLMGRSLWMRMPYLLGYGVLMLLMRENGLTNWLTETPQSWVYAIPIGLQVCHYHLDAYLWRFSTPFVRETVLKHL